TPRPRLRLGQFRAKGVDTMHECFANPERNDGFDADSSPSRDDPCRRALRPIEASEAAVCYVRNTSTPAVFGARFYAPASHCFATNTLNEIQVRHTERLSGRWRPRAVRRGTCRRSSCTGQLARIRARRSSGHLLRGSQSAKNSYPTRSLAERSVPHVAIRTFWATVADLCSGRRIMDRGS